MKSLVKNTTGVAGITVLAILLIFTGAVVVGTVAFSQPDITYNITDAGFSIAGIGSDTLTLIVGAIVVILIVFFLWRSAVKKNKK